MAPGAPTLHRARAWRTNALWRGPRHRRHGDDLCTGPPLHSDAGIHNGACAGNMPGGRARHGLRRERTAAAVRPRAGHHDAHTTTHTPATPAAHPGLGGRQSTVAQAPSCTAAKHGLRAPAPAEVWRRTKQVLRTAAAAVRDSEMATTTNSWATARQRALQLMRAVDRNEVRLLRRVLSGWPEAQAVVGERGDDVYVRDDAALRQLLALTLYPPGAAPAGGADAPERRRKGARRVEEPRTRRWMQLRVPHRQRTWLARVTLDEAAGAEGGRQLTPDEALHACWSMRFQPSGIDERLQTAVVRVWTPPMVAEWPLPSATSIGRSLRRSKKTSPGPDGLPHGIWKAS